MPRAVSDAITVADARAGPDAFARLKMSALDQRPRAVADDRTVA